MGDTKKVLGFSPYGELTKPDDPKPAPKPPPPLTLEDPNVKQAAAAKRKSLKGSREAARVLSTGRAATTLG